MSNSSPNFDLWQWILGVVALIGTPLVGMTVGWSKKVNARLNDHDTEIAVFKNTHEHIKESLERIEERLETRPRE